MITSLGAVLIGLGAACVAFGLVVFVVGRRRVRTAPRADNEADPIPALATESSCTVLVTGASSPRGVAVIRCLVRAGYEVVATDSDALAPGLRLAQLGAVAPSETAADYPVTLAKIARRAGARVLVPGDTAGVIALSHNTDVIREAGVATWIPSPETVSLCSDRWTLHEHLVGAGIPVAPTRLGTIAGVPGPWSVRPRLVDDPAVEFECDSVDAVILHASRMFGFLVSSRPSGREFGAEILADRDRALIASVCYWRLRTEGREVLAAETFEEKQLQTLLQSVANSVNLEGPATVTGVMTRDGAVMTDIELGFGSAVALCASAGADIVSAYVETTRGECTKGRVLAYRSGMRMVRHLDEVFDS
jgi:hypothetical protein